MDGLRKLFDRFVGEAGSQGSGNDTLGRQTELGAHGDHWGCVLRADDEEELIGALRTLAARQDLAEVVAEQDGVRLLASPTTTSPAASVKTESSTTPPNDCSSSPSGKRSRSHAVAISTSSCGTRSATLRSTLSAARSSGD